MPTQQNQFTDKFKFLTTASKSIFDLKTQTTQILNRLLPSRTLSKMNIFGLSIDLAQDLANTVMLQVEDSLIEQNILVAQKELSIRGLATLTGHQAVRPISAHGIVELKMKPQLQLVAGPKIIISGSAVFKNTSNSLNYVMRQGQNMSISTADGVVLLDLIEGVRDKAKYVAAGYKLEKFELDAVGAIEQSNVKVLVNGEVWTAADHFYDMGSSSKQYITKNGLGNQVDIVFGDDVHGRGLVEGDIVEAHFLITNGELGNVELATTFTATSGVYDINGQSIELNDTAQILALSGFVLGSNGENIETTRNIAGYTSKSRVFARPENLKAYLSRLSILSHIAVWTDQDDLVFNLLLLPNIAQKINTYSDYFYLPTSAFTLTANQSAQIVEYINTSGSQVTSSELVLRQPTFKPYCMFLYINATFVDKKRLRTEIEDRIAQVMLESTFIDQDMTSDILITQSQFLERLLELKEIRQATIDIVSEENELARINGEYNAVVTEYIGSALRKSTVVRKVPTTTNPNLGFDELGGIQNLNPREIPIMKGGFKKWNGDLEPIVLNKPIYIFYKTDNGYETL